MEPVATKAGKRDLKVAWIRMVGRLLWRRVWRGISDGGGEAGGGSIVQSIYDDEFVVVRVGICRFMWVWVRRERTIGGGEIKISFWYLDSHLPL